MILTDCHLHTAFSADSEAQAEEMIQKGIALGYHTLCFTDHMDLDYPEKYMDFTFDSEVYWKEMNRLKEQYQDQIEILIGVELGLQPGLKMKNKQFAGKHPFDFIIGSTHLLDGWDLYYQDEHPGAEPAEVLQDYFDEIYVNIQEFDGFHSLGHLDYAVRYVKGGFRDYEWTRYEEQIEKILAYLIAHNIGLEINTSGYKIDGGYCNPHPGIMKKYRQMGGEIVTIGSDAHIPEYIGYGFREAEKVLADAGFDEYAVFRQGKLHFQPLGAHKK